MALPRRSTTGELPAFREQLPTALAPTLTSVVDDGNNLAALASPARLLQEHLAAHFDDRQGPADERWAPRRTLLFAMSASALLWTILLAGVHALRS